MIGEIWDVIKTVFGDKKYKKNLKYDDEDDYDDFSIFDNNFFYDYENGYRKEKAVKKTSKIIKKPISIYRKMMRITPKNYKNFQVQYKSEEFYLQAKFMENYEVEKEYKYNRNMQISIRNYRDLKGKNIRAYFSWRTRIRKEIETTGPSLFISLYISELINNIGISYRHEAFEKICFLYYGCTDNYLLANSIKRTLKDYCIYYQLDESYYVEIPEIEKEYSFILTNMFKSIDNKKFGNFTEHISAFSKYKILNSKFYEKFKDDYDEALKLVYKSLEQFYKKNRKIPLFQKLFGKEHKVSYNPFMNTLFYDVNKSNCNVKINEFENYVCKSGFWEKHGYSESEVDKNLIGEILKTIEFYLRNNYKFASKIKIKSTSKVLEELIEKSVEKYCIENNKYKLSKKNKIEEIEPIIIEIDTTKFDEIRKISGQIQEKLIIETDEKEYEINRSEKNTSSIEKAMKQNTDSIEKEVKGDYTSKETDMERFVNRLDEHEKKLLYSIASKENEKIQQILIDSNNMLSILLESINEKSLECIADNIIEVNDESPYVYDEYLDELKIYLGIIK